MTRHHLAKEVPLTSELLFALPLFALIVAIAGCAPSAQEVQAQRTREMQAQAAGRARVAELKASLKKRAEERAAAGERPPEQVADPGHQIVRCVGFSPVPTITNIRLLAIDPPARICGNSVEGAKILANREWYCGGRVADCTLPEWVSGEPTLDPPISMVMKFNNMAFTPMY